MLSRDQEQVQAIQYVYLEDLVPQDHILRRIRKALDLDMIYEATKGCYSERLGRPSVDPTVAFRMMLLGYLFNLSEKRLCEEVQMHAGYRWFCGLDFNTPVPDRTTLVKLRRHKWGEKVFREVMEAVVRQCIEAGLVKGRAIVVDGTAVQARAAVTSLEAITPPVSLEEYLNRLDQEGEEASDREDPPSAPSRRAGDPDFHGERFSNATHRSKTDPDARLFRKGNEGARLSYLVHDVIDLKSGVILATKATHAFAAKEREAALDLLDAISVRLGPMLPLKYLLADMGYTAAEFLAQVLARGLEPIVPTKTVAKSRVPGRLRRRVIGLDEGRAHRLRVRTAQAARHVLERPSPPKWGHARVRIERCFAEAKELHGLRRARYIGLAMMNIQALMTATVQNLRRLAKACRKEAAGVARLLPEALQAIRAASSSLVQLARHLLRPPRLTSRRPAFSQLF